MKLAYRLELYRSARLDVPVELVRRAEALGYHSVWSAEAYGTDALSLFSASGYAFAFGSGLRRDQTSSSVIQVGGRVPACATT